MEGFWGGLEGAPVCREPLPAGRVRNWLGCNSASYMTMSSRTRNRPSGSWSIWNQPHGECLQVFDQGDCNNVTSEGSFHLMVMAPELDIFYIQRTM